MTDSAERKVRQWALKRNGAPLEAQDVVELVFAFDDDNEARHEDLVDQMATFTAEGGVRNGRIEALERWRVSQEEKYEARMSEHHMLHREDDKSGSDYRKERGDEGEETARQTFFMWTLGSKLGAAFLAILVAVVVTLVNATLSCLWFGHP